MTPATPATPSALERYRPLLPLAALLTLLVGFAKLAEDVWTSEPFRWDVPILSALHNAHTSLLDGVMLGLTSVGGAAGMALLAASVLSWLLYRRQTAQALFFALAAGGAALLNPLLKAVFHRARPDLWPQLTPERDYSFPSGHAMGSLTVVAALMVLAWPTRWRWWVATPGGLFVLSVGLSRLYLGVHFPSDVLAGWLAGLLWVSAVALGLQRRAARSA